MLADVYTPVGVYLRLRDHYRDTILLESTDFHAGENSYSFIGINAIAGVEVKDYATIETKLPGEKAVSETIREASLVPGRLQQFMKQFESVATSDPVSKLAQTFFGYTSWEAIPFFENIQFKAAASQAMNRCIPMMRYRLYQYVLVFDHFRDELHLCENVFPGLEGDVAAIESFIRSKDVPVYPFRCNGSEQSNLTDEGYIDLVKRGIQSCYRGDVFQIVLSRCFSQSFRGDEFNVYRALRSVNPSPYLFFFDYGDYRLMGSSPESQLIIRNGKATVHPIAGTFKRTGNDETDQALAKALEKDEKENAEHVMLVDLARNDLSRLCRDVSVTRFRQIQFYSHVIHLVSEVQGKLPEVYNPFEMLAASFPAGTLSGAPKYRALQLIDELEPDSRGYYGGAIGGIGLDGTCNHAILIRSFLSRNNQLFYQAGAGIVAASNPASELAEVNNKLNALKKALELAQSI